MPFGGDWLETNDVPALLHSTACRNGREDYSSHFITAESIAVFGLLRSAPTNVKSCARIVSNVSHVNHSPSGSDSKCSRRRHATKARR